MTSSRRPACSPSRTIFIIYSGKTLASSSPRLNTPVVLRVSCMALRICCSSWAEVSSSIMAIPSEGEMPAFRTEEIWLQKEASSWGDRTFTLLSFIFLTNPFYIIGE